MYSSKVSEIERVCINKGQIQLWVQNKGIEWWLDNAKMKCDDYYKQFGDRH